MLPYLVRRLLFAVPTLLVISFLTFAMSRFTTADPVKANYAENPTAYLNEAKMLGLDQPAFYFTFTSAAFPDTLHRVLPLEKRENLENWTRQNGNWAAVARFWEQVTTDLDPDLKQASGPVLTAFKSVRQAARLEHLPELFRRLQNGIDTVQNKPLQAILQRQYSNITARYNALEQQRQPWKLAIPAFYWHGAGNQYHRWLSDFISGNPGRSVVTGNPLLAELRPRLAITLMLNGMALLLAYFIGVPLGVFMAQRHQRPFDRWMRGALLFLYAMPIVWLGSLLILLLSRPDIGLGIIDGMNAEPWQISGKPFGQWFRDNAVKFVLPVLTLSLHILAVIAMQMRSGILEVAKQDYIRTAWAKGLTGNQVYWTHAFRNALFPIITIFAQYFPIIFSGSLVIEYLFDFPGMGYKMQQAFANNDYAVLFAMVQFVAFVTIMGSILADVLYAWADPRVRFAKR